MRDLLGTKTDQTSVVIGNISANLQTKTVLVRGKKVNLSEKEYQVLAVIVRRKNTVVTKSIMMKHLYGEEKKRKLKILEVFICKLRKKLATANGGEDLIDSVWGRGYIMRDSTTKQETTDNNSDSKLWRDLPKPSNQRWVASCKYAILRAIRDTNKSIVTDETVLARYHMAPEELAEWRDLFVRYGIKGLDATRRR